MAPRPLRALVPVLATALVALVAACGATAPAAPTAPPPSAAAPVPPAAPAPTSAVDPAVWTESVCSALLPVVRGLAAAPPVRLNEPETTRQAYLTYLAAGLATTDRARTALDAAGPAPVANGDAIADQVRGTVADLRADLVEAQQQVQQVDPTSTVALGRALVSGTNLVSALLNGAKVAGTINRDPVLHAAYDRSPSCADLARTGTALPTAPAVPQPTR